MSYIGQGLPSDVFAGFTIDKFTGTGVASQTLTLSKAPLGETALLVTIDGVVQEPTDDFTVSGTTVTIVGTAPLNSEINVTHLSGTVPNTLASAVDVNGLSDGIILDTDGDSTISSDTDDQIDFKVGGNDTHVFDANGHITIKQFLDATTAGGRINGASNRGTNARINLYQSAGSSDGGEIRFETANTSNTLVENARITLGGYFKSSRDADFYSVSSSFHEFNNSVNNEQVLTLTHHGASVNAYGLFIKFNDNAPDNASQWFIACHDNAASRFQVMSDGDIQTHDANINSDSSLKENIVDATSKWDDVKALKVRNFNWIKDYHPNRQHKHIGFIAQEFETVFPNLVRENNIAPKLKYTEDDKEVIDGTKKVGDDIDPVMKKSIKQSALIPILTKTLQEAMAKIEVLETKVAALEAG